MSKRVVKKKAKEPPPVEKPEAPAPKAKPAAAPPAAVATPTDARVAQQMRVMEVVGANAVTEKDDKKYSPRTENWIKQLLPVLDHYQYSRNDIAALVQRCHYGEAQIQIAVSELMEDRANHETTSWGTVKGKKQMKEEKKLKEEEEQKEQERLERELEKQRKDADKRLAREQAAAARSGRGGKGGQSWGGDAGAGSNSLPPDPAILFAGQKPASCQSGGEKDEWWEGFSSKWASGEWEDPDDRADRSNEWENGNEWDWQNGRWPEDEWAEGGSKGGDEWWSGDWEKADKTSGGRGKRGAKEPRERGSGGAPKKESKDSADIWDMPDTAADANQGGLDQWALGDIRAHERRVAGGSIEEDPLMGLPKVPPASAMRTVEEIEAEQLRAGGLPPAEPPSSPPLGLPPGVPAGGSGGKNRIDMLLQSQDAGGASAPENEKGGREKGEKGRGRGGKDKGGKGGKNADRPERPERPERPRRERAESEADAPENGDKEKLERIDRSDDPRRQAIEQVGENVTVKKHSSMGCAVISLRDPRVRQAILADLGERATVAGTAVQLKPHFDKDTKIEVMTDIFAAWGRQVEKTNPLPERDLMQFFEAKHQEFVDSWRAQAEAKAQEEDRARQAKLLEEQRRQVEEQNAREERRRRFEEDLTRRREEEMKKQQEDQLRIQRQAGTDAAKAKYINDLQGQWAGMQPGPAASGAVDPRAAAAAAAAGLGAASSAQQVAAATAAAAQQQQARAADPSASAAASASAASAAGLNPAASAYGAQGAQAAAAQQWQAQWMQAMYNAQAQAGWQQQMAQRGAMGQQMAAQAAMGQQTMGTQQDYENQLRAHAAYHAYVTDQQHRGQSAAAAAAYAQYAQAQQQGGYIPGAGGQQQNFNYNAAAAAYGQRGERI